MREQWITHMEMLNERQLRRLVCRLFGRTGISNDEFIKLCNEYMEA